MDVRYEVAGGRATVAIDRPDRMNALTVAAARELQESLARGGDEARVVVLTGTADAFCAGGDLKESPISGDQSFDELQRALGAFQSVTRTIRTLPVPVVARVNGPATGAGCDIALAADFRVAAEDALFAESFVDVGVVPGDGGTFLLPRHVGESTAKEMLLLGREVSGEQAADLGFVTAAVPAEELDDAVDSLVDEVLSLPPLAVGRVKQLVNDSFQQDVDQTFTDALYAMYACLQSDDLAEARAAFREGREPDFSSD